MRVFRLVCTRKDLTRVDTHDYEKLEETCVYTQLRQTC